MKENTIFITYNPKSDLEQTLAVRLHTIGAVNGFRMFLPDRYNSETILDNETKSRISQSDYFIFFSTSLLSKIVESEIEYAHKALKNKARIIIVFDNKMDLKSIASKKDHFTAIPFEPEKDSQEAVVKKVVGIIKNEVTKAHPIHVQEKEQKIIKHRNEHIQALTALFIIAIGLFALAAIVNED